MRKITLKYPLLLFSLMTALLFVVSCEEEETPDNPYDDVNYNTNNGTTLPEPDPASIQGLHKNIFSKKCALSGCHDGTFEPDFRTVESSYASLVYQPVIKNTVNEIDTFFLRVVPNEPQNSFLYERVTTPTTEYMPSNGVRLPQSDINNIQAWINNGARDENGTLPVKPNLQPNVLFYVATDPAFINIRYDTSRVDGNPINPFIIPYNTPFDIIYAASDALDGPDSTAVSAFTNCKVKFSTNKDDFSSATTVPSQYLVLAPFWYSILNSSAWPQGSIIYFRIYINDGHHTTDSEFPRNESPDYYKTYYSFYVQ